MMPMIEPTCQSENGPQQYSMLLWPSFDPNAHKKGLFSVFVDSQELGKALRALDLPKGATPDVRLLVLRRDLHILASTNEGGFTAHLRVPLFEDSNVGPIAIGASVNRERLARACAACPPSRLRLEIRRSDNALGIYIYDDGVERAWFDLPCQWLGEQCEHTPVQEKGEPIILDATLKALNRISPFATDAKAPRSFDGVQFTSEAAYGGSDRVFARYSIDGLPTTAFRVPFRHLSNVRSFAHNLRGNARIAIGEARIGVWSDIGSCEWQWNGSWQSDPEASLRMASYPIKIAPHDLAREIHLLAALFPEVSWNIEQLGESAFVRFEAKTSSRRMFIREPIISTDAEIAAPEQAGMRLVVPTKAIRCALATELSTLCMGFSSHTLGIEAANQHGTLVLRLAGTSAS